jgi:hypothetical protein
MLSSLSSTPTLIAAGMDAQTLAVIQNLLSTALNAAKASNSYRSDVAATK